jgi:hypothetical protein
MDTSPAGKSSAKPVADAVNTAPSGASAIDLRSLVGVAFGPGVAAVLVAALAQSLGHWFGRDVVADAGGPAALVLGSAVLLYAVFALMHGLHAMGDALLGEETPLWWQPEQVGEEENETLALPAAPAFPCHLDGAVLSGGLSLACWLAVCALG